MQITFFFSVIVTSVFLLSGCNQQPKDVRVDENQNLKIHEEINQEVKDQINEKTSTKFPSKRADPNNKTVEIWEDGKRMDEPLGFEWWYFDGILDNGTKFVIIWGINQPSNIPYIAINFYLPNGESIVESLTFSPLEYSSSSEKCDVTMGKNILSGDLKKYSMSVKSEKIKLNLTFESITQPWRVEDNQHYFRNGTYYAWIVAQPSAKIKGNIDIDGKTIDVSGLGYHDHNWSNMSHNDLGNILGYRYWGRVINNDYTVIFNKVVSKKDSGSQWLGKLYLAKGNEVLIDYNGNDSNFQLDEINNEVITRYIKDDLGIVIKAEKNKPITEFKAVKNNYWRYSAPTLVEIIRGEDKKTINMESIWEYANYGE